ECPLGTGALPVPDQAAVLVEAPGEAAAGVVDQRDQPTRAVVLVRVDRARLVADQGQQTGLVAEGHLPPERGDLGQHPPVQVVRVAHQNPMAPVGGRPRVGETLSVVSLAVVVTAWCPLVPEPQNDAGARPWYLRLLPSSTCLSVMSL